MYIVHVLSILFATIVAQIHAMEMSSPAVPTLKELCLQKIVAYSDDQNFKNKINDQTLPAECLENIKKCIDTLQQESSKTIARLFHHHLFRIPIKNISNNLYDHIDCNSYQSAENNGLRGTINVHNQVILEDTHNNDRLVLHHPATHIILTNDPMLIWTFNSLLGSVCCYNSHGDLLHFFNAPAYYNSEGKIVSENNNVKVLRKRRKGNEIIINEQNFDRFQRFVSYSQQMTLADLQKLQSFQENIEISQQYKNNIFKTWAKRYSQEKKKRGLSTSATSAKRQKRK